MKTFLAIILIVIAALAGFFSYALRPAALDDSPAWSADRETALALAGAPGDELPISIDYLSMATVSLPDFLVRSAGKFAWRDLTAFAYRINYADGRYILLDAGSDAVSLQKFAPRHQFNAAGFARVQQLALAADAIVLTHEHYDHCATLSRHPEFEQFADRLYLTHEQINNPRASACAFNNEQKQRITPLEYDAMHRLRPGVVLIRAPGHTPGSQMIYVQLSNGRHYLFGGDIAWVMDNIDGVKPHPRVTNWLVRENASLMAAQLAFLDTIRRQMNNVYVIPGHDGNAIDRLAAQGLLTPLR